MSSTVDVGLFGRRRGYTKKRGTETKEALMEIQGMVFCNGANQSRQGD